MEPTFLDTVLQLWPTVPELRSNHWDCNPLLLARPSALVILKTDVQYYGHRMTLTGQGEGNVVGKYEAYDRIPPGGKSRCGR